MIARRNSNPAGEAAIRRPRPIHGARGTLRPAKESAARKITQFVVDHPVLALGASLMVGALLGWLVKRR